MSTITTTASEARTGATAWVPSRLHRMTVEDYERVVARGVIPSHNGLHLINGYLVDKATQNPPHAVADLRCGGELGRIVPPGWHVRSAKPVRLPAVVSEPEPDHCIVRGAIDDYLEQHPGPADVALVVEIADSSLADDRDYAARLYGPVGIPACWIVDVNGRRVEVYTATGPQGYGPPAIYTEGQSVPVVIGGQEIGRIAVADILPPLRPRAQAEVNGA